MALIQRSFQKLINKNFIPAIVPTLVHKEAMLTTGYLPYGEEQIYQVKNDDNTTMYLVGTAEVPLVAQHIDETFSDKELPLRYV
jgi:seryl-tRNA synthetase